MFRFNATRFAAPAAVETRSKLQTLHKILLGEVQFKNKAAVKESNIEHQFGANWKKELNEYAAKLGAEEKKILDRQVARLNATRYTTRELATFGGNGAAHLDAAAHSAMVCQAVGYLNANGEQAFVDYVNKEAKNANWSKSQAQQFIDEVKASKGKK